MFREEEKAAMISSFGANYECIANWTVYRSKEQSVVSLPPSHFKICVGLILLKKI